MYRAQRTAFPSVLPLFSVYCVQHFLYCTVVWAKHRKRKEETLLMPPIQKQLFKTLYPVSNVQVKLWSGIVFLLMQRFLSFLTSTGIRYSGSHVLGSFAGKRQKKNLRAKTEPQITTILGLSFWFVSKRARFFLSWIETKNLIKTK